MVQRQSGFTLLELMIVVVIISILAAIAFPSYREYVRKGNRGAAQAQMMDIANRQQQFLLANRDYASSLTELNFTLDSDVDQNYNAAVSLDCDSNGSEDSTEGKPPCFRITLTATGDQDKDGDLILDSMGNKSRDGVASKW